MKVSRHPGAAAARITVPDQPDNQIREIDYIRWLSQMQADIAESLGGVMLRGARPVPIGTAPGGSPHPLTSPGRLVGWSVRETSGADAAVVALWDAREAGSRPLAYISLAGGASDTRMLSPGVSVVDALFVEVVSGAVEGVVYLGAAG